MGCIGLRRLNERRVGVRAEVHPKIVTIYELGLEDLRALHRDGTRARKNSCVNFSVAGSLLNKNLSIYIAAQISSRNRKSA